VFVSSGLAGSAPSRGVLVTDLVTTTTAVRRGHHVSSLENQSTRRITRWPYVAALLAPHAVVIAVAFALAAARHRDLRDRYLTNLQVGR
jgi:hypothetical protein